MLDSPTVYILYQTLVVAYLTYCTEIWVNTYKTTINGIYMLVQKKVIRVVAKESCYSHTKPLFHALGILNIFDIGLVKFKTALIMYKACHKTLPRSIQVYFTQLDETHGSGSGQEFFKRVSLDPLIPACVSACMCRADEE